ncbi:MAG TPA: hypothetical protein VNH40_10940 [Gaiellaceae bacterium]|nr:hypothetical protein [Gaiellaceae bacterium]
MSRILAFVATAAAVVSVVASSASARTASIPRYLVTGIETSVPTGDTSTFAGTAFSLRAGWAKWNASVQHDSLTACVQGGPSPCSSVTGGDFSLGSLSGHFSGGAINFMSGDPIGCTTSTTVYDVSGTVNAGSDTATFHVRLTHYQTKLFGRCIPYFATVVGTFGGS